MSSVKPPFVLVFDVDGTLIDSRGYLNHSVVELLCLGIIAREHGIVSAILILTNNVFSTNRNRTQGHVMEWLTTTLVPKIIDYIVNHRYIEFRYRRTPSKIFNIASQIISDKYPNKNVKNIMNANNETKRFFSKIFDEIFDKRAREVSNLNKDIKSMEAVSVMLSKAGKNASNIRQRVFFINDDETHNIGHDMNGNDMNKKTQYIHIDPMFNLSPNLKTNLRKIQSEQQNINSKLKNQPNNSNLERNKLIKNNEYKILQNKIHTYLKQVSNNINSKLKITELKRLLKDKIREQGITINNSNNS